MGSATKTVSYRYDANRNRTLMIDPDGGRTTYAYDALNRITSLINPQGERTTYAYDAKGRRTVKKLANGTRASFTYDAANRLTTLANLKSDNTVISKFDYKYDNVGNRTEVAEADGSRVTWSYDDTYQLTAEHRTGTTPYRNTFTYDSVGNRLLKDESGARTTYSYDAANQLKTSIDATGTTTYTFDADGNQELVQAPNNDRTTTLWDFENKATAIQLPSGIRNTMSYEPDGLRVKLEDSTGTKKFIWDDQNYLAESDENNDINVVYTNEPAFYGNLISQRRSSATSWYHYEALGSTRQLTDASEVITDTYLYDAWGNVLSSTGTTANPFQFTGNVGYYFDVDTGNQYIRARVYSPIIGRWMSVDPLGFIDGLNLFHTSFVPSKFDPSGMVTVEYKPTGNASEFPWEKKKHLQGGKSLGQTEYDTSATCKCARKCKVIGYRAELVYDFELGSEYILVPILKTSYELSCHAKFWGRIQISPDRINDPAINRTGLTLNTVYGHEQRHIQCGMAITQHIVETILQPAEGDYVTRNECNAAKADAERKASKENIKLKMQDFVDHGRPFPVCPKAHKGYTPLPRSTP